MILKVTVELIRQGGYNGFSFREIAKAVGIKSSSVHYHFPTKEILGAEVAKHYTQRFMDTLGNPQSIASEGQDPIRVYVSVFKRALTQDKRMCLCGLLGAEIDGLPPAVVVETQNFFNQNLRWLEEAFAITDTPENAKQQASATLSLLEGAMITSNVLKDIELFDHAAAMVLAGRNPSQA